MGEGNLVVVFEVSGQTCALPLKSVREVTPMCMLAQPPGLPPCLAGLLNLRGEMIPVVRLDQLFNLAPITPQRYTQILVLRAPTPLALLSNRALGVTSLDQAEPLPAPPDSIFNRCVEGVARVGENVIHVLSVERLLLEQERQRITELQELAQIRLARLEEAHS